MLRSKQVSSQTVAKENTKSASDAAKTIVPSMESDEPAGAPKTASIAATTKSAAGNAASAEKKVAANSRAENKKMPENKKQP